MQQQVPFAGYSDTDSRDHITSGHLPHGVSFREQEGHEQNQRTSPAPVAGDSRKANYESLPDYVKERMHIPPSQRRGLHDWRR